MKFAVHACVIQVLLFGLLARANADVKAGETQSTKLDFIQCDGVDGEVRFELGVSLATLDHSFTIHEMRIPDPNMSAAYAEIAMFREVDRVLTNVGNEIRAYPLATNPGTSRRGERIGGTLLGRLREITLILDPAFKFKPEPDRVYSAQVIYKKKPRPSSQDPEQNPEQDPEQDLDCKLVSARSER
jgi:hypothetical protein